MQTNRMLRGIFLCIIAVFGITACSFGTKNDPEPKASENKTAEKSSGDSAKGEKDSTKEDSNDAEETGDAKKTPEAKKPAPDKSECLKAGKSGKKLIPNQTFVFDFAPFRGACFVTFASVEDMVDATDVPRGSTFHIFNNGRSVFDFEDAFDGQSACWVEGVGFEDLNGDGAIEVIVAGSCLSARDSYPANAVYVNMDGDLRTFPGKNESLNDFKTVKQIANYVKRNQGSFF